jgi:hypothetical protein
MTILTVTAGTISDFSDATVVSGQVGQNQGATFIIQPPSLKESGVIKLASVPPGKKLYAMVSQEPLAYGMLAIFSTWSVEDLQVGSYTDMLPIASSKSPFIWLYLETNYPDVTPSIEKDSQGHFILNAAHTKPWYITVFADLAEGETAVINAQGKTQLTK